MSNEEWDYRYENSKAFRSSVLEDGEKFMMGTLIAILGIGAVIATLSAGSCLFQGGKYLYNKFNQNQPKIEQIVPTNSLESKISK